MINTYGNRRAKNELKDYLWLAITRSTRWYADTIPNV
jgi:hypothetical protein